MLRIFIGYDPRQPVSYNVLQQSLLIRSSKPVAITPLILEQLPIKRYGLTPFTFSRFIVPYLCDYKGWALFLDVDMLLLSDISKLFDLADDKYAVMVSKNKIKFEWASAMLFNCDKCRILTPEYVETAKHLHGIEWAKDEEIGDLPNEWNHLVGYDKVREGVAGADTAKLVHYTQGIPFFPETENCEYAKEWMEELGIMGTSYPWIHLMGRSAHAVEDTKGNIVPRYKMEPPL